LSVSEATNAGRRGKVEKILLDVTIWKQAESDGEVRRNPAVKKNKGMDSLNITTWKRKGKMGGH